MASASSPSTHCSTHCTLASATIMPSTCSCLFWKLKRTLLSLPYSVSLILFATFSFLKHPLPLASMASHTPGFPLLSLHPPSLPVIFLSPSLQDHYVRCFSNRSSTAPSPWGDPGLCCSHLSSELQTHTSAVHSPLLLHRAPQPQMAKGKNVIFIPDLLHRRKCHRFNQKPGCHS